MANIRSAEKQNRKAQKARVRNRAGVSRLRSALKKARTTIQGGEEKTIRQELTRTYSEIDKAAKKKLIKPNTASRYKSRLAAAARRTSP
jgi:small subunit ribosomal protein S20